MNIPFKLPMPDALPGANATLEQIRRFAHFNDPTAHFQRCWGDEYKKNAQSLWRQCIQSYKAGSPPGGTSEELLMCLTYDIVISPYLGVPDSNNLPFLRWLLEGIRLKLEDPTEV
jgi:hypothetical protein